jgi:hypothetical protein
MLRKQTRNLKEIYVCMSEQYGGHEMLNHLRERIRVSEGTIQTLNMCGYLRRDRETGLLWLDGMSFLVFSEAEYGSQMHRELGQDCSGPNQVVCHCEKCKELLASENDDAHISGVRTSQIVREVRERRAASARTRRYKQCMQQSRDTQPTW